MGMIMMYAHETLIWKLETPGLVLMLALSTPFLDLNAQRKTKSIANVIHAKDLETSQLKQLIVMHLLQEISSTVQEVP
jgi:hypothetical protein